MVITAFYHAARPMHVTSAFGFARCRGRISEMRSTAAFPIVAALALAGLAGAEEEKNGAAAAAEAPARSLSCVIGGTTAVRADTEIFDQQTAGAAVAKLTGGALPLTLSHFPKSMQGRLRLATSRGKSAVRIEGWVEADRMRFIAERDLPLVGGHVWLTGGMQVELVGASPAGFTLRHTIVGSDGQALEGPIPCDAVSLELVPVTAAEPPKNARNYQMKGDTLDLYDRAGGQVVFTLRMAEGARKVFWSTEARGGFLHVMSRGDITIDAWARASDLSYLRHAELFDLTALAPKPLPEPRLALSDPPDILTATADMPIHPLPQNAKTPVGAVEAGARFYPLEQSGDWTNVMPEGLAVLPADGRGFWVRTAGLPKK